MGKNKDKNQSRKRKKIQDKRKLEHRRKEENRKILSALEGFAYDPLTRTVQPSKVRKRVSFRHLSREPDQSKEPVFAWFLKIPMAPFGQQELRDIYGIGYGAENLTCANVFYIKYKEKVFYLCLSGGEFVDENPEFTPIGKATYEALFQIFTEKEPVIRFIALSKGSVEEQIRTILEEEESETRICLLGDMADTLDGLIYPIFEGIISSYPLPY